MSQPVITRRAGKIVGGKFVLESESTPIRKELFQEELANQEVGQIMTDKVFMAGLPNLQQQFAGEEKALEFGLKKLAKQGFKPSDDATYQASMANEPWDPRAFISTRGEVEALCRERGDSVRGAVNCDYYREPEVDPMEAAPGLAPDICKQVVDRQIAANPDLAKKNRRDLEEEVSFQNKKALKQCGLG